MLADVTSGRDLANTEAHVNRSSLLVDERLTTISAAPIVIARGRGHRTELQAPHVMPDRPGRHGHHQ
jgi:hypothetical protein